ncbi:MAG: hypothetical protein ABII00_06215 [Elusimicrobiota bacterium]
MPLLKAVLSTASSRLTRAPVIGRPFLRVCLRWALYCSIRCGFSSETRQSPKKSSMVRIAIASLSKEDLLVLA